MTSIGEQKLFASWAAGFRQTKTGCFQLLQIKHIEAQIALDKHIKRNINHISGVPMCNPSNHFISLLPGASKKLDSGS